MFWATGSKTTISRRRCEYIFFGCRFLRSRCRWLSLHGSTIHRLPSQLRYRAHRRKHLISHTASQTSAARIEYSRNNRTPPCSPIVNNNLLTACTSAGSALTAASSCDTVTELLDSHGRLSKHHNFLWWHGSKSRAACQLAQHRQEQHSIQQLSGKSADSTRQCSQTGAVNVLIWRVNPQRRLPERVQLTLKTVPTSSQL